MNNKQVFLNILSYQPLEPGQDVSGEIRPARVRDDLRRLCALRGSLDPIVLRVYAQPTPQFPERMPAEFYDGLRELGYWVIRDVFFDENYLAADAAANGRNAIDMVIREVESVGAWDRIFAWEIGNEFGTVAPNTDPRITALNGFLCEMLSYLKGRLAELRERGIAVSDWVTWNAFPPTDPLRTDGRPVVVQCPNVDFDFFSINAYAYEPQRLRDHQGGVATGTPYAGYLAALKERLSDRPVVVSETGLSDSPVANPGHMRFEPFYPSYRKGGLSSAQVAEGLADRYWDARLVAIGGLSFFEYSDEWFKSGNPSVQEDDRPEEHFGLISYSVPGFEAQAKLQFLSVVDLFRRTFPARPRLIRGLEATPSSISCRGSARIRADPARDGLRYRWETSRGFIAGDAAEVVLLAGARALGPATVTAVATDESGLSTMASIVVGVEPCAAEATLEGLTLGRGSNSVAVASGRVNDIDLSRFKVVAYIETDQLYVQPFLDMRSVWGRSDGYFWTPVDNQFSPSKIRFWLVPTSFDPPAVRPRSWRPPGRVASAVLAAVNDTDNDLLPDGWERTHFGNVTSEDRHGDPDADEANNLEEYLHDGSPVTADNDRDGDGLNDHWERRFFGSIDTAVGNGDPDGDGLDNWEEMRAGLHPGRTAVDRDQDALPDLWEHQVLGGLNAAPEDSFPGSNLSNLEAYRAGLGCLSAPRTNAFDLSGRSMQFLRRPKGTSVVRSNLGFKDLIGDKLDLGDDDSRMIRFPDGFTFPFRDEVYRSAFVHSDGNVTFGRGDTASTQRGVARLRDGPARLAPLFTDLDPGAATGGNGVYLSFPPGRVRITWLGVPAFGSGNESTFQLTLFTTGRATFVYGDVNVGRAVVGLSPGAGESPLHLIDYSAELPFRPQKVAVAERFDAPAPAMCRCN